MSALDQLLQHVAEAGGTDLVVKAGSSPHVRVGGQLLPTPFPPMDAQQAGSLLAGLVPAERAAEFGSGGETAFTHAVPGVGRFRITAFRQRGTLAVVARRVATSLPGPEELGLPPVLDRLCAPGRGLVLVTGPVGSGVSTTLNALVDYVNAHRPCHIVTVEKPIEYLHADKQAMVSQREIGADAPSVGAAVAGAGRLGADVIAVGTLETLDDVQAILAAVELGSLVFAVVPAATGAEGIVRMVDVFPEAERPRARARLASVLRGVLGQRLLDRADGRGRVAVFTVVLGTSKVAECLAANRLEDLPRLVADGQYSGMQSLDRGLALLVADGLLSVGDALSAADDPEALRGALSTLVGRVE